jgi:hypothetical protein
MQTAEAKSGGVMDYWLHTTDSPKVSPLAMITVEKGIRLMITEI